MSENDIRKLEMLSSQDQCKLHGRYGLDLLKSQTNVPRATSFRGSVAGSGSDEEGDIINVTDDDEVVSQTTDINSCTSQDLQFKVSS